MFNLLSPHFQIIGLVCRRTFFGLEPWYQYLTLDNNTCEVTSFKNNQNVLGSQSPFLLIALAILDDLIRIAALVAVAFVIAGGVKYVTSQGSPDETTEARGTIINALIGLLLALVAATLVSYIGNKLGGLSK